jgi:hypothetical protein
MGFVAFLPKGPALISPIGEPLTEVADHLPRQTFRRISTGADIHDPQSVTRVEVRWLEQTGVINECLVSLVRQECPSHKPDRLLGIPEDFILVQINSR